MKNNFVQTFDHYSNCYLNPYPSQGILNQDHVGMSSKRGNFKLNLNDSFWVNEWLVKEVA